MAESGCILVVDDNEDIANLVRDILKKDGYNVYKFCNPCLAFEFFRKHSEKFSMIITDVKMPSMSGIELVSKAKGIKSSIKAVLVTAFDRDIIDDEIERHHLEVIEILKKPVHLRKLQMCVSRHLDTIGDTRHG